MLSNYSRFPPIEEKEFLAGSQIARALENLASFYLRNEFWKDVHEFLEELMSTVLSTFAAQSGVGQGLSCFFSEIVVGWMTMPLLICSTSFQTAYWRWLGVSGSTMEASEVEFWSFVREQKQLERISTRSRPHVENILSSWSPQSGSRARSHS